METLRKIDSNFLEQIIPEQKIRISREQLEAELASLDAEKARIEEVMREPFKDQLAQLEEYKKTILEKLNLFK